ncbi:MAG: protease modulator HflC [Halanaerobiales bacterium]|nr:protease modulator HflC [Halanaerobiales bacterium]
MNKTWIRWILGVALILVILLYGFTFVLYEGKIAVVTRFGAPRLAVEEAGLHWKLPWPFEKVFLFDGRRHYCDTSYVETLTKDKKNVILQTYLIWSVNDPIRFLQSTGSQESAELQLNSMILNAKNGVLGKYDFSALVSTNQDELKLKEIETEILSDVKDVALESYGITVHQIGLKRLGLPEANIIYVFGQMKAERLQYASKFRAEGQRDASKIRNEADVEVAKLKAEGMSTAAKITGEAEAEVAKIYAEAYAENPEFYSFLRKLQSLERILNYNSTLIFTNDSAPFDVFSEPNGVDE